LTIFKKSMPMNAPQSLATAHLILRKPNRGDAPNLFASYVRDPEVTRFLRWRPHAGLSKSEAFIENALQKWDAGSELPWFLFTRASSELIGSISARIEQNEIELGYVLARSFWGHGFILEAITAVVDWAFTQSWVVRVIALCDMENQASARVLEKAGFLREGVRERHLVLPNLSEVPRDCYLYAKAR
jgi:[ribosomal protein S5]-alanine N-acetyltransferase